METVVIIDGGYFCFYRYHALVNWWRLSHPDESHIGNAMFFEKFKKIVGEHLSPKGILKRLGVGLSGRLLIAKDCKRKDIWRIHHWPEYKLGRAEPPEDMAPFFAAVYEICQSSGIQILAHPSLEADDCAALYVKHGGCNQFIIITSDHDYFQLPILNIKLMNLAFKEIGVGRDPAFELFCKIVKGDKCDNIKPIFSRCGPKTLEKYFKDNSLLVEELKREGKSCDLNRLLVDFNQIPIEIVEEYKNKNLCI